MLTMTLIQTGQLEKAMQGAVASALIFPKDPNFTLVQAVIYAIRRDSEMANMRLDKARNRLTELQVENFENSLKSISELTNVIDVMDSWEAGNSFAEKATQLLKVHVSGWMKQPPDVRRGICKWSFLMDLLCLMSLGRDAHCLITFLIICKW